MHSGEPGRWDWLIICLRVAGVIVLSALALVLSLTLIEILKTM